MFQNGISQLGIFLLKLLSSMPLRLLYLFADVCYLLIYYVIGYRKKVVRENLLKSFPDKSPMELLAIEKKFFRYLSSLIVEVIKMQSISADELKKRMHFKNTDRVEKYLKNNQSVLFCTSHNGNYEWLCVGIGLAFSGQHYPIYKPLSSQSFDKWFINMRSRFGNRMTSMRQTPRVISATKDFPTMFTFGSDQSPSREDSQYWTTLFNQQAAIQLGVEKIAKKTNRPVFYLKTSYVKRGYYEVDCIPVCLDPSTTKEFEITELHTRILENMLIEEPAYWLWSHRRWKYKPTNSSSSELIKNSSS